jgi:hypothetical protein
LLTGTIGEVSIALAALLAVLFAILGYRLWQSSRVRPAERERRRRAQLSASGKLTDAALLDYQDGHLVYSYRVRGVEYTASQDVTAIGELIPADVATLGPVSTKYDARNPANSIVVSETWIGLRTK